MQEHKLIATNIVGKPMLAIVIGACYVAEPDATRGIWYENDGKSIYAIINADEVDDLKELVSLMNYMSSVRKYDSYRCSKLYRLFKKLNASQLIWDEYYRFGEVNPTFC